MELQRRTMIGLTWNSSARVLQQVAQLAALIVLARFVAPDEYGLVAVAVAVIGFCTLLAEFGFGSVLVQKEIVEEPHLSSIFWLTLALGTALAATIAVTAPLVASYFAGPDLIPILRVLSLGLLVSSAAVVPRAILQRRLAFRTIAGIEIAATVIACLLAIGIGLVGGGIWSVVAQVVLTSAALSIGYTMWAAWRPRLQFSMRSVQELSMSGVGIAGFNAVNFGARNIDDLIIGRILGASALGLYGRAYALMLIPVVQATAATGSVLLPALSAARHDQQAAQRIYLAVTGVMMLVTLPLLTGILVTAESLVPLLLGADWMDLIPVLRILCLAGCVQILLSPVGWIYQAYGASRLLFRWGLGSSAVLVAAFAIGAWFGSISAVAWCYVGGLVLLIFPGLAIPGRLLGLHATGMLRAAAGPACCAAAMAAIVVGVGALLPSSFPPIARLAVEVPTGILTYTVLTLLSGGVSLEQTRAFFSQRQSRAIGPLPVEAQL